MLFEVAPETALRAPSTGPEERSADEEEHGRADVKEEVDLGQAVVRDGRVRQYDVPDPQERRELDGLRFRVRGKAWWLHGKGRLRTGISCERRVHTQRKE